MALLVIQTSVRGVNVYCVGSPHPVIIFMNTADADDWLKLKGYQCIDDTCRNIDLKQQHLGYVPSLDYISGIYTTESETYVEVHNSATSTL